MHDARDLRRGAIAKLRSPPKRFGVTKVKTREGERERREEGAGSPYIYDACDFSGRFDRIACENARRGVSLSLSLSETDAVSREID